MEQAIIDRAVNIATRSALQGIPVEKVVWIPPESAGDRGGFAIIYAEYPLPSTEIPPWENA